MHAKRAQRIRDRVRQAAAGGGTLSRESPGDEPPDEYTYDPADPAPTLGGPTLLPASFMRNNSGPMDQRRLEARPDVLVPVATPVMDARR